MTGCTFLLLPGAGSDGWYWHLVAPLLEANGHHVVPVDLPCADPSAGLREYTDAAIDALAASGAPTDAVVVVAQSMGGFTAPLVCERTPVRLMVLVAAMVPLPGEPPGEWWANTGHEEARRTAARRDGRDPDEIVDQMFLHDVPADVVAQSVAHLHEQSGTPFERPWPLAAWPDSSHPVPAVSATTGSSRPSSSDAWCASGWASCPTR